MENSESETDALERLLEKMSLTPSTRRLSFCEVSFENEPDLVSGAINPSSHGDILHLDDHTYHGGHSSTRVTSQDIKTKKRKQSFTKYSFENLPDLLSASSNPISLGDILPLDDHTHHGGHSSRIELTMDPLSKKRKLSHTIDSSENQPQVALDLEESPGNIYSNETLGATCATISSESDRLSPMLETASSNPISLGDILPLDDHTHHGGHSSRIELTMDPLSKKRKLSHTIDSSENQPQVALDLEESPGNIYSNETLGATCATISSESDRLSPMLETASSNPISLGDILPLDDHTHHGGHSSRIELTMDPLSKKRKLSHTIDSSENQPQVALDLEESPGNIYSNETLGATCATISSESDRLSPMLETASSNPISLGDILPLDDHTHHGGHSSRIELTMDPLSKKRKLSHTIDSSENQPQVALDLEESPGNIYFDDTLSLNSIDSLSSESDRLSPMLETKIFLTESEDENMICLEVFQPMATENTFCQFQMMKNQPLLQLMIPYCLYAEIELSEAKFIFEGKVITETDTPESLQMENQDLIVVYYK